MIKKVFGILAIIALIASCATKEQKKETTNEKEIIKVSVDEVVANMQKFVDQEMVIEGVVNHVCAHGGKRMFIMGADPDVAIKITPNDKIGVFEKELEGSHVIVTGIFKELRIDEAYVTNLEKEISEGSDNEAIHDHSKGTHDKTEEANNEKKAQIDAMKERIAETENGYYSQYWIEAEKFEVLEPANEEMEAEEHEHTEGEEHSH